MRNLIVAMIALLIAAPATADEFQLFPEPPDHDEQLLNLTNLNRGAIEVLRDDQTDIEAGVALSNAIGMHQFAPFGAGPQWSLSLGAFRGESAGSAAMLVPVGRDHALTFAAGVSSRGDEGAAVSLVGRF